MTRIESVAGKLTLLSRPGADAEARFDWSAIDRDRLALPEELLSLAGTPELAALSDEERWRLSVLELCRFFSLNVAGEARLCDGLDSRAAGASAPSIRTYLGDVAREERDHSRVFRRFCLRYGTLYPDRQLHLPDDPLPGEVDFTFHTQALLFEEIACWFNRRIAEADGVWPLARAINAYHAEDEVRHIAYGRVAACSLWDEHAHAWGEHGRTRIVGRLLAFIDSTLRLYVEPAVYRDAGLAQNPYELRRIALASPAREAVADAAAKRARRFVAGLAVAT